MIGSLILDKQPCILLVSQSERIPAGRWGNPADFVGPTIFLASAASQYVSGEMLVVDGVSAKIIFPPLDANADCPECLFAIYRDGWADNLYRIVAGSHPRRIYMHAYFFITTQLTAHSP